MRAGKCGELKLKTDFLATFGQPPPTPLRMDTIEASANTNIHFPNALRKALPFFHPVNDEFQD